jgi:hypothetical protein
MSDKPAHMIISKEDADAVEAMLARLPAAEFEKLMAIPEVAEAAAAPMPVVELSEADRGLL